NLLIQNLLHTWRYSLANSYERFSWEMVDVAEVLGEYGFTGVERQIVKASFHRRSVFPNRAVGVRMAGVADYYRRTGDKRLVGRAPRHAPAQRRRCVRVVPSGGAGLLPVLAVRSRRAALRLGHGFVGGEVLEPGHAVRARVGAVPAREARGDGRAAVLPGPRV